MTNAHMDTGEQFLFDVDEVFEVLRVTVEEAAVTVWANQREQIVVNMLDHLFYGSRLSGERELERLLIDFGVEEYAAIKNSRKLYETLLITLCLDQQDSLGSGLYVYWLDMDYRTLVVSRQLYNAPVPGHDPQLNPDRLLHEIERSLESGDYVPERIRRLVNVHRT